ncbi:calcium-binding protein, partial [Colwellia sp. MEBiC06753]
MTTPISYLGGKGNDTIIGGENTTTYYFNLGDGNDVIDDEGGIYDRIVLGEGITPDDLTIEVHEPHLHIFFTSGDSVKVSNWYVLEEGNSKIEFIEFADGTVWNETDIGQRTTIIGTDEGKLWDYSHSNIGLGHQGGKGDDVTIGGTGSDTYYFNLGDGNDVIGDEGGIYDRIVLGEGITPDDLTIEVHEPHLHIFFTSGDSVKVSNWYVLEEGNSKIEFIEFADGTVWNETDIGQRTTIIGTDEGKLWDYSHSNIGLGHQGGKGDDVTIGGTGSDTYYFNLGDGNDVIYDAGGSKDRIVFGESINPEEISLVIDGTSGDLIISISENDIITVSNWYNGTSFGIEEFVFNNGITWSGWDASKQSSVIGTDGDDNWNFLSAYVDHHHYAGKGNDTIAGGKFTDYYYFNIGDGHDVIDDGGNAANHGNDTIVFGEGITPDNLTIEVHGDDMIFTLDSGDTLTVKGWYVESDNGGKIEYVEFKDGTKWDENKIGQNSKLVGTDGDDNWSYLTTVIDQHHHAGKGNDTIAGGKFTDYYYFNIGDGHDVIDDGGNAANHGNDTIVFGEGITPDNLTIEVHGDDMIFTLDSGDTLTVKGWYVESDNGGKIEYVEFKDGTKWDENKIGQNSKLVGTDGDDNWSYLTTVIDQHHHAGKGNDTIAGGKFTDYYYFNIGDGHDVIDDGGNAANHGRDTIVFGEGITPENVTMTEVEGDLIFTLESGDTLTVTYWLNDYDNGSKIEYVQFADGTKWGEAEIGGRTVVEGTLGDDILDYGTSPVKLNFDGKAGNDTIVGGLAGDSFHFGIGDGHDVIDDTGHQSWHGNDTIVFGEGITPDNLTIEVHGDDMIFTLDSGDTLTVKGWFVVSDNGGKIEYVEFKDGTKWDENKIGQNSKLVGTDGDDNWSYLTTAIDQHHHAGKGNDTIAGGKFTDYYYFNIGDGHDVIDDGGNAANHGNDTIVFGEGITLESIDAKVIGEDLIISLDTGDSLTVRNWYLENENNGKIEYFQFADGSKWHENIFGEFIKITGTDLDDTWNYSGSQMRLSHVGGEGNDNLVGGNYRDFYHFNVGDGHDVIDDSGRGSSGSPDHIRFGDGITPDNITVEVHGQDMIFTLHSGDTLTVKDWFVEEENNGKIEYVEFKDGTTWSEGPLGVNTRIIGTNANDYWDYSDTSLSLGYQGGAGDDEISGGTDVDFYYFNVGDGHDVIDDAGTLWNKYDYIRFGEGITADNISVEIHGNDMIFTLHSGDTITIKNWYVEQEGNGKIEVVEFFDGTTWGEDDIGRNTKIIGTQGDDVIDHRNSNVEMGHFGGKGNDEIFGGIDNDYYYFNRGDGHDIIDDAGTDWWEYDYIRFGEGITPDNLTIEVHGDDMIFTLDSGDTLTVKNWFVDEEQNGKIEIIEFADGTTWDEYELGKRTTVIGTAGDDYWDYSTNIRHLNHRGGKGDDTILGTTKNDVYFYSAGDGNDTLLDTGGYDVIEFNDLLSSDVTFYESEQDLIIHIKDYGEIITVKDYRLNIFENYKFIDAEISHLEVLNQVNPLPENLAPSSRKLPNISVLKMASFIFNAGAYFKDADGDALQYSASFVINDEEPIIYQGLPPGLTIDENTGVIFGTLANQAMYQIEITATDGLQTTSQEFTLEVTELNVVPTYEGEQNFLTVAGDFFRQSVVFNDGNGDVLSFDKSTLPDWLSYDAETQELFGYAPLNVQDITFDLVADDGRGGELTVIFNLSITARPIVNLTPVNLPTQTLELNDILNFNINSYFSELTGNKTYTLQLAQPDGSYFDVDEEHWLNINNGWVSGLANIVTKGLEVRVVATNELGEQQYGDMSIIVNGAKASQLGTIEQVSGQQFSVDIKPYFTGLSANAKYGVRIELPESEQQTQYASPVVMGEGGEEPQGQTLTIEPDVIIPEPLNQWLTFDTETGRLSGTPPAEFIEALKITLIATDNNVELTAEGTLDFDKAGESEEYWFTYDAKGQVIIDAGSLVGTSIVIDEQGHFYEYDAMGNRIKTYSKGGHQAELMHYSAQGFLLSAQQSYDNDSTTGTNLLELYQAVGNFGSTKFATTITHAYDLTGQVTDTVKYFEPETFFSVEDVESIDFVGSYNVNFELTHGVKSRQQFTYNSDGQVINVLETGWTDIKLDSVLRKIAEEFGPNTPYYSHQFNASDLGENASNITETTYQYISGIKQQMVYRQFDKAMGQAGSQPRQFVHNFSYHYDAREHYLESQVNGSSSVDSYKPSSTNSFYDIQGQLIAVEESNEASSKIQARYMDMSTDGKLLRKQSGEQSQTHLGALPTQPIDGETGNPEPQSEATIANTIAYIQDTFHITGENEVDNDTHYMHAAGNFLGQFRADGKVEVKAHHLSAFNLDASNSTRHTIREGDSLRSLATLFYGSSELWFIIADANGLTSEPDDALVTGQTITIPKQANSTNSFEQFNGINLQELIGNTNPMLPYVPSPSEAGCNAVAQAVMVAVAVVVTYYTGGAAAGALSSNTAGFAIGAAAGSAASQTTGLALGEVDSFSWSQVAVAAVGGAITGGVMDAAGLPASGLDGVPANGANVGTNGLVNGKEISILVATDANGVATGLSTTGRAVAGAASTIGASAVSKMSTGHSSFSWANVAASAASASVGSSLPGEFNSVGDFLGDVAMNIAASGAGYIANRVLRGDRSWNNDAVATDAFGNAVGNSIVSGLSKSPQPSKEDLERQAKLDAMSRQLGQDAS